MAVCVAFDMSGSPVHAAAKGGKARLSAIFSFPCSR
jgi:hypothetical protein